MTKSSSRWIIALITLAATTRLASVKLVKSYDGAKVHCGPSATPPEIASKVIQMELLADNSTEDQVQVQIAMTIVKCDGTKWVVDSHPSDGSYKTIGGDGSQLAVKEKYSEARLNILTDERVFLGQIKMDQLFKDGTLTTDISIPKNLIADHQLQLTLLANKTVAASNGYSDVLPTIFGSFNLNLF